MAYNWLPYQVDRLTLRQVRIYVCPESELKGIKLDSQSQATSYAKAIASKKKKAIENLKAGRRWDFKIEDM